ncbi:hypothetical protein BH23CHL5_BH23CHL5_09590 [soil metagenome]
MRGRKPSHSARRISWRALAGAFVLAGTLLSGAMAPTITFAQSSSGYLGFDTPSFSVGQSVAVRTDDGGGLSLRMEASASSELLQSVRDGTSLVVIDGPFYDGFGNGWYLVGYDGIRAFAYAGFLVAGSQQSSGQAVTSSSQTSGSQSSSGFLGYDTPSFTAGQSVVVRTDDGGGLSLRMEASLSAERLQSVKDGTVLSVVDGPFYDGSGNGWYLVRSGSVRAFAFAGFLAASSQPASTAPSSASTVSTSSTGSLDFDTPSFSAGQSVVVQTDDGGGLSLRMEASLSAERLQSVKDGTVLTVVDGPFYDGSGIGWYLVRSGSIRAFAFAGFLAASSQPERTSQSSSVQAAAATSSGFLGFDTPSFSAGQSVVVQTDDGGGLSLRMEASLSAEKLQAVRDGSTLTIVDGPIYDGSGNGWYLVRNGAIRAFAFAGFLAVSSQPATTSSQQSSASSSSDLVLDTPSFSAGQAVVVATDDGGGLSLRMEANASAERLQAVKDGTALTIVDGPYYDGSGNGWYLVRSGSTRAFALGAYLTPSSQPADPSPTQSSASPPSTRSAQFAIGDMVMPNDGSINIRNGATVTGSLLGVLTSQNIAAITDGPFFDRNGDDWYYVVGDSVQGFAVGNLLASAASVASQQTAAATGPTGSFIFPLEKYTFTQAYGCSNLGFYAYDPNFGCAVHNGIDLAAPSYTPILAADGGRVSQAGWCDCGLGYYVKIDHGNGFVTTYGHMAEMPYVRVGQQVNQGDVIGPIGSTGLSTGPHIHFMIERNGAVVNPLDYL